MRLSRVRFHNAPGYRIAAFAGLLAAVAGGDSGQADATTAARREEARRVEEEKKVSKLEYHTGRLSYRRKSTGAERGREDFSVTRNRDGSLTMRAVAMTDDSHFIRDVTYTAGKDRRPKDAFIRLQVGERVQGTGYFQILGNRLRITADASDTGRTVQELEAPERFHIITHAVMLDGWPFWALDPKGPNEQRIAVYNTSTKWNGTDGPLGRMETLVIRYIGEEEVTVPAGRFPCRHYRFESPDLPSIPVSDVFVHGDLSLLVRYDWGGLDLEYVLTRLDREEH
jgi:hypothetical protein